MIENPYTPIKAEVVDICEESSSIKTFTFKPDKPMHFKAGQFVEISIPGVGEAPFTPSSSPYQKM